MYDYTGWIVQATAGRDQGDLFCVVGVYALSSSLVDVWVMLFFSVVG